MQQRQWTKTIEKELESSMASLSNWSIASAPIIACLLTSHDMRIIKLVSVIHQVSCYLQPSTIIIDTMITVMRYFEVFIVRLLPVRYIQHQSSPLSGSIQSIHYLLGSPDGTVLKNLPANEETQVWSGRSPGEGNGNPLHYFCLGNPMDRRVWQATVHGVVKELDMTLQLNNNNSTYYSLTSFSLMQNISQTL